jgi:nitrate/TMAO reductase-like tetraheme cytochrome c subunit
VTRAAAGGAIRLIAVAWLTAGAAAQAPPSDADCLACHAEPSLTRATGQPVAVDPSRLAASVHAGLGCVDCHADLAGVTEFPHAERLAPPACATCHADASQALETSVHARPAGVDPGRLPTCASCHGAHDIRGVRDPQSPAYALNLPATCGTCHTGTAVLGAYQDSIHGRALSRAGLIVAPNCSSCHGAHDVRRRTDAQSRVHPANVPATCGSCHAGVERQYASSVHAAALRGGQANAPSCASCHSAHGVRAADVAAWQLQVIEQCGTCHAESLRTYRDTFHGQVTALGFTLVATCADCHGPHGIRPASHPESSVAPGNLVATCGTCHAQASPNFVEYDPHADRHDRARNPQLYFAARFMDALLLGVFGFFGVHTTLWMARSWRLRRHHGPGPPSAPQRKHETPEASGDHAPPPEAPSAGEPPE